MAALIVYLLCALTSLLSAVLLLVTYRKTHARLLLWSGLCFAGFFLSNAFLVLDFRIFPEVNLFIWRSFPTLVGLLFLLYGLIWETR